MNIEQKKGEQEKENFKQQNVKKETILCELQGMIKDYKKNAKEKKYRYNQAIGDSTQDSSVFF